MFYFLVSLTIFQYLAIRVHAQVLKGKTPGFNEPGEQFAGQFIMEDAITSGNWGGVFGKEAT